MGLKPDHWIRRMAQQQGMIEPFVDGQVREYSDQGDPLSEPEMKKVISYGLSSYGYDMRIANEFKIFHNALNGIVDPKNFSPDTFIDFTGDVCVIPPNSFVLARSIEYFRIPRKVTAICLGKSTYARVGLVANITPLESEWEGYVTLEISNTTPCPARIYANEGIAQVLFFEADEECDTSYADRKGKYQGQVGITPARI